MNDNYEKVVFDILSLANLRKSHLTWFVNNSFFHNVFIHKSFDSEYNYEYLELRGDCVINFAIVQYICYRFPKIKSSKWLTRLNHVLRSTQYLSKIAKDFDFEKYIKTRLDEKTYKSYINSILEDSFEAFMGAIVCSQEYEKGVGYALVYLLISILFDRYEISLNVDDLFDIKSRVKEIYDSLKWNFNDKSIKNQYYVSDKGMNKFVVKMKAYPKGDKSVSESNVVEYDAYSRYSFDDAYIYLYKKMLYDFVRHGIIEKITDPYLSHTLEREEEGSFLESVNLFPDIEDFREKIIKIFSIAHLNEEYIKRFSQDIYLVEYRKCFIDKTFDEVVNMEVSLFEGAAAIDCVVIDYLVKMTKIEKKESAITTAKQNIIGRTEIFQNVFKDIGFEKYILFGKKLEEIFDKYQNRENNSQYIKFTNDCIKSLIGCIVHIFDRDIVRGSGFVVVYNFLLPYLQKLNISLIKETNYKSKLKEYYDRNRYNIGLLRDNIIYTYNKDMAIHNIKIKYRDKIIAESSNKNKNVAEENASKIAFQKLNL